MKQPRPSGGPPRHAGIIAAGHGSRLALSHPGEIKPLIAVAGRPLCHWVAASLLQSGIRDISLLHNSGGRAVRESLERAFPQARWTFLQADTASSWESFRLLSRALADSAEAFLMSTVDALVAPEDAARFGQMAASCGAQAGLALTSFVDDEKPLWADLGEDGFIQALGERCARREYATSGLYYMTAHAASHMPEAGAYESLRRYWSGLVEAGVRVAGYPLSKTIDVDRPEDIAQAEGFLKEASASW